MVIRPGCETLDAYSDFGSDVFFISLFNEIYIAIVWLKHLNEYRLSVGNVFLESIGNPLAPIQCVEPKIWLLR